MEYGTYRPTGSKKHPKLIVYVWEEFRFQEKRIKHGDYLEFNGPYISLSKYKHGKKHGFNYFFDEKSTILTLYINGEPFNTSGYDIPVTSKEVQLFLILTGLAFDVNADQHEKLMNRATTEQEIENIRQKMISREIQYNYNRELKKTSIASKKQKLLIDEYFSKSL